MEEFEALCKGVNFCKNKAKNIMKTAEILEDKYAGDIPETYKGLLALPGIGPKSALMIMNVCFEKNEGIIVDSNVHRIANRVGWVTTDAENKTKEHLEAIVPQKYWNDMHFRLVDFGQTICLPKSPKCRECPLLEVCAFGSTQVNKVVKKVVKERELAADKKGETMLS
mmetsp:Transcript_2534/g.5805  ORF Transcript_2534/g.5805 Transcript_2534/m.5805 type:complete len:168 (-) Transcript_2534:119-622(-)